MKKLTLLLVFCSLTLSGCGVYGNGSTQGYVYTVDEGFFGWNAVWFKTSLDSSESDCYVVESGEIRNQLAGLMNGEKLKLTYKRHIATLGCGDDEIIKVEKI